MGNFYTELQFRGVLSRGSESGANAYDDIGLPDRKLRQPLSRKRVNFLRCAPLSHPGWCFFLPGFCDMQRNRPAEKDRNSASVDPEKDTAAGLSKERAYDYKTLS